MGMGKGARDPGQAMVARSAVASTGDTALRGARRLLPTLAAPRASCRALVPSYDRTRIHSARGDRRPGGRLLRAKRAPDR